MEFDILGIIELLQKYGYELDIIPVEGKRVRIKVRSGESYSSKTIDLDMESRYIGDLNILIHRRVLEVIMNLKIFKDGYMPMRCSCGGLLYDKSNGQDPYYRCIRCEKTYPSWALKYDQIGINSMTGWRFPMIKRKKEEVSE